MKLLKVFSISFFILLSFVFVDTSFAVVPPTAKKPPIENQTNTITDITIKNAKIILQKDNILNLSFDIVNGQGAQSGLKYGASISNKDGITIDEYAYQESFNISENTTLKKEIVYNAPNHLDGEYTLILRIYNSNGKLLGISNFIKVPLTPSLNSVKIMGESCYLSVQDEDGDKKYILTQGVDIKPTEKIILNCTVINPLNKDITVTPVYETYINTISGEIVKTEGGDILPISFNSSEEKNISLVLPNTTKSGSYAIKLLFKNNNFLSNSVVANYIVIGINAEVQNVSLNKDSYKNGDTGNLSFSWSYSAGIPSMRSYQNVSKKVLTKEDIAQKEILKAKFLEENKDKNFDAPVLKAQASIKDSMMKECAPILEKDLDTKLSGTNIIIPFTITSDCVKPQVLLTLSDEKGNLLYSKVFSFGAELPIIGGALIRNNNLILIILGILVVAGITFYFIKLKKKQNETITK
jgi:hypothetical protein